MVCRTRERIGLEDAHAVAAGDEELVAHSGADAWAEELPHARATEHPHRPGPRIPEVRVAHDAHPERIRGPDAERRAEDALVLDDARAEHPPELRVGALADEVEVELAERRREPVRVLLLPVALVVVEADSIARSSGRHAHLEQSGCIETAHLRDAVHARDARRGRLRVESADPDCFTFHARAEQFVRVAETAGEHLLHRCLELGRDRVVDRH